MRKHPDKYNKDVEDCLLYLMKRLEYKSREIKLTLNENLAKYDLGKLEARQTDVGFYMLQKETRKKDFPFSTAFSYNVYDAPEFHQFQKVEKKLLQEQAKSQEVMELSFKVLERHHLENWIGEGIHAEGEHEQAKNEV